MIELDDLVSVIAEMNGAVNHRARVERKYARVCDEAAILKATVCERVAIEVNRLVLIETISNIESIPRKQLPQVRDRRLD